MREVYCFGESRGFVLGEYGMLGVLGLIVVAMGVVAFKMRTEEEEEDSSVVVLKQRMTELYELEKKPVPVEE